MPYADKTLKEFLDALATKEAVPGGGSSAALAGALGAALVSMVCNLTLGKKGYQQVEEQVTEILERSEELRGRLMRLMEEDIEAYMQVLDASRMSRNTLQQKLARDKALQASLRKAAQVPLQVAKACAEVIEAAAEVAPIGSALVISDSAVGALLSWAALESAALNVKANQKFIKDEVFATQLGIQLAEVVEGKREQAEMAANTAEERI